MFRLFSSMQITFNPQLNFNRPEKTIAFRKFSQKPTHQYDTVTFSGRITKDLMELPAKRILLECKKAIKDNIILGEGKEARVYKIQAYPQYCIRCEKSSNFDINQFKLSKRLSSYDKLNHVVAKLDEGTSLMKYIPGVPLKIMDTDTADGIKVKNTIKGLVANNFSESPFKKIIAQVEDAKAKGIDFDRRGENLHVDPLSQEMVCFDFSPRYHDTAYNPISYIYSALDVDKTEYAPKVFGKLCKAYAQRLLEVPTKKLNLQYLDTNFYHRGIRNDAFNNFPNKTLLDITSRRLQFLVKVKSNPENPKQYLKSLVEEFKQFIDERIIPITKKSFEE